MLLIFNIPLIDTTVVLTFLFSIEIVSPIKEFISVDLPALVLPIIANLIILCEIMGKN